MIECKLSAQGVYIPVAQVYGFTSRSVDRYKPGVEILTLQSKFYPPIEMDLNLVMNKAYRGQNRIAKLGKFFKSRSVRLGSGTHVDMRFFSPDNWAHNIFYHTPLAIQIQKALGEKLTIILPTGLNKNIYDLYELLDLDFIATDMDVEGRIISFDESKVEIATLGRREWIQEKILELHRNIAAKSNMGTFPEKVFVNRRDTRKLKNDIVPKILKEQGFVEVFLEDYSAAEQIGILSTATFIVGIHGAGLAPILYSGTSKKRKKLVGLMPALQVTSGFRLLCHQCNMSWVGVRGKVEPSHTKYLYRERLPPLKTSHADFEICPASLLMALEEMLSCEAR